MKLKTPCCPTCNKPATGTVESLKGVAEFAGDPSAGPVEYGGNTKVWWDEQKTDRDEKGRAIVVCEEGHDWPTEIEEPQHGEG